MGDRDMAINYVGPQRLRWIEAGDMWTSSLMANGGDLLVSAPAGG